MTGREHSFRPWRDRPVRSLWLEQALAGEPEGEVLSGAERADVCVLGGGYTGLWTALRLRELDPSLDVVLVEAGVCGGGASGRNGGFVHAWWPKLPTLLKLAGREEALAVVRATVLALDEIEAFCRARLLDADFARGGWLWTATSPAQVGAWSTVLEAAASVGERPFRVLGGPELAARLGSPRHLGGILDPAAASVQPAVLARGLRRAAAAAGVRVFERSPVRRLVAGSDVTVECGRGTVRAPSAVLALNAWMAHLPDCRPSVAVVSSDVVATEPVQDRLAALGWTGGESVANSRLLIDYYRTTRDGRLVFGRGGGTLAFDARIGPGFEHSRRQTRTVLGDLRSLFPSLADARVTHAWSGPVDRSRTGLPWFAPLEGGASVWYGIGFSGNGVAATWLAGRILASSVLGRDDEWAALGRTLAAARRGTFPREPVRYLGGRAVRAAVVRKERAENEGRTASRPVRALAGLAPTGLADIRR